MNKKQLLLLNLIALIFLMPAGYAAKEYQGELQWEKRVELGLPVSGVVSNVSARAGDSVKKGQLLVSLDQRLFDALVMEARAMVAKTKQTMMDAKREYERAQVLYDRTVLADTELEAAKTAYLTAEAAHDSAKAKLRQTQVDRSFSRLKAPFDGVVARRNVEVGQTIVSRLQAEPLIILVATERMRAQITVPVNDLDQFTVGKSVMVKIGTRIFSGKIDLIGVEPVRTDKGVQYEIDVEFSTENHFLRAGQRAKVVMP